MEAIKLENVKKNYQTKDECIHAIDDITYTFQYGKFYAIMGHSGSGKSTLIQCIGLLDIIDSGKIFIEGENITTLSAKEKNKIKNEKIGFVFQNYYLNNTMRAYENVMLPMFINKKFKSTDKKARAIELLKSVDLENRYNHFPKELSGGEQQRVAIARALANNPSIILADEPTGNLDEKNETGILNILKELAEEGKCVIVVSHNNTIYNYADEVIHIRYGKVVSTDNES